jgi:hypothetical protein
MHHSVRALPTALLLLLAGLALPAVARAQGVTGSAVTGTVTDETSAPVDGAVVQIRNPATGAVFSATSTTSGEFFLDNLPAGGPYTITAGAAGFNTTTQRGIVLSLGQRFKIDVVLRYHVEDFTIEGHYDELDDKARTGASTTVKDNTIAQLPLQGRNFTDLIATAPQVTGNSFAGQNNRFNNIQIDGGSNNDLFGLSFTGTPGGLTNAKPLSLEAIQEFVVQVSPFDVRQGSFAGGLVNAITKSGTNEFHGGAFVYEQNKVLAGYQDDPTFLNFNTTQFGAFLGGPIIKDKVHFFLTADLQVKNQAFGNQYQIAGVKPDEDRMRAGFDNAIAQRFENDLARYGITDQGNALSRNLSNPDRNVFVKLSTSVIKNSNLELTYNLVDSSLDVLTRAPTAPSEPNSLRDGYQLSNAGYTQVSNNNTVRAKLTTNFMGGKISNEFLGGASFLRDKRVLASDNPAPLILVKAGTLGAADSWLAAGAERFSQDNYLNQDIYQVQDNVTFALGKHRLTAGTSNDFLNLKNRFLQAAIGVWSFNSPDPRTPCTDTSCPSLDAFEAGTASTFQRRFGGSSAQEPGTAAFSVAQLGYYVQDEWSIGKNLTLTPGIRMDVPFLSSAVTNPALIYNGSLLQIDTSKVPSGNVLWSPRLGFNWDIKGDSNTILRGGLGMFTGRPPYVWVGNAYSTNGLSQVQLTCFGPTGVPKFTPNGRMQPSDCAGGTGVPRPPTDQGEIDYFDPNTKYPQNLRAALGMDRRLPLGVVGTFDFLYSRDVNGWYTTDENLRYLGQSGENRAMYGTVSGTGVGAPSRLDTVHLDQAVKVYNKDGGRVYNATVQFQKEFANRYDVSLAYTYSNSQDRMSLASQQGLSNFRFAPVDGPLDDRNVRPSAFDRPHKVTLTGTATLPKGFLVGLTYVGMSGLPYTWAVNGDVNADGINGNDLVFVPRDPSQITLMDPTQYAALSKFIDSQDCLREARGRLIQRGECRNPWQNVVNLRAGWRSKDFHGQHFEVQVDVFDFLNLLNSSWGVLDQVTPNETSASAFLRAVGFDGTNNRPIYSFTAPQKIETPVYSPTTSRWRIQLGARYIF